MSLDRYQQKRRFDRTPEPAGGVPASGGFLRFVVQKHAASRLHYDFRLEFDGVLKSWAVPKGPSMSPADKRLAVMVEDHPVAYELFEGIIPKGNYGAGTVMVWDKGSYQPPNAAERAEQERALRRGFEKGHLEILLAGQKLRGLFDLVKTHGGEENAWLLIKRSDVFAHTDDVLAQDRSVISGRSMEEIAAESLADGDVWLPDNPDQISLDDAPLAPMPERPAPMLARPVAAVFDSPEWIYEVKWDGYRVMAAVRNGEADLYSRNSQDRTTAFPEVAAALAGMKHDAIVDGELVAIGDDDKPSFGALQRAWKGEAVPLVYYAFDLLYLDGHDLQKLRLVRRKGLLRAVLPDAPILRYSDHVAGRGTDFYRAIEQQGLEGLMAKKADSPYLSGRRSDTWRKIKIRQTAEVIIAGYTRPNGTREGFGALVIAREQDGHLAFAGHVGTGFDAPTIHAILDRLRPLMTDHTPFAVEPETNEKVTWIRPEARAEVAFSEWTDDGRMRHPVFVRLLPGGETAPVSDAPRPAAPAAPRVQGGRLLKTRSPDYVVTAGTRDITITNPDKPYWPEDKIRKRDLVDYFRSVAPLILPFLRDRPLSLHRFPDGITGQSFFQKDVADAPDWVETFAIASGSADRRVRYVVCQDEATLVYLANLGCIELNPWLSRTSAPDRPDFAVIDLDPEGIGFEHVVEAACCVREILVAGGAPAYCKTSGATGLHVFVPLRGHSPTLGPKTHLGPKGRVGYEQARQFAELVCTLAHARLPETTSLRRDPARRQGKIYLDYLQNRAGQTIVAAYSPRPRPGAPVSTPLHWDEVISGLQPADFTIATLSERVGGADPWTNIEDDALDLPRFLERIAV
jgi:bifunctional non-homologous end joining protein LigD